MSKLTLTTERKAIIEKSLDEWLSVGLSTEPANFDLAETAITQLYESIGKKRPYFVRLSSPFGAELYINLLTKIWPKIDRGQLWDQLGDQLGVQLRDQLRGQLGVQLRDQLGDQLRGQLGVQLGGQLWGQLRDQLWDQLRDQLGVQLEDQLGVQLRDQLRDQLRGQLGVQLGDQLGDQLGGQLWGQLRDQLWDQLGDQLRGQLGVQLRDQLRGQLRDQLWDQLGVQLENSKLKFMGTWFYGQWDYYWAWLDGGRRVGAKYDPKLGAALDAHCQIMRSVGWWYPFSDFCILTDRPDVIARDERGALHNTEGAALRYRDGYGVYAVHGARLPAWVIESPEQITVAKIDSEHNAEVRRVMTDRYMHGHEIAGIGAYIRDAGGERLDHDERWGTLWRREVPGDEPILSLEVINRSPEPDGHYRHYFLRVQPELRPLPPGDWTQERQQEFLRAQKPQKMTAHNAVASLHGLRGEDYAPLVES